MPRLSLEERLSLLRGLGKKASVYDYLPAIVSEFTELSGDRAYGDDPAVLGGIGMLEDTPVTVLAQARPRTVEELERTNCAMPHPEGYRKALRLARQAEKFHRPVIAFIDTPGAFCGVGAEERGQSEAIARSLMAFMNLRTPVISVVLGEGGSGGALALGVCDELAMLENAVFSIISPRGFASILWKDGSREIEAARLMKIRAEEVRDFGICDAIIPELGVIDTAERLKAYLLSTIARLSHIDIDALLQKRYQKFRSIGVFSDSGGGPSGTSPAP
ncbi:MAG: acetyl-CoA carboxylase carboxyl transferase subunit alpha [Spirochaetaceae bacterium]|jgi:acetyl-CoA carboxylase carboxyl transferase subunit alpha|nr:acetyl-CoA carboxylase carboxyl transferase subunit alpha [Spirochaetaceae bacterium]